MNDPIIHPSNGNFVKDTLELFSDYFSSRSENESLSMALCFRSVNSDSSRISNININGYFSYTKYNRLISDIFRKDTCLFSYKGGSFIRDSFECSVRPVSFIKAHQGTEENQNTTFKATGVKS